MAYIYLVPSSRARCDGATVAGGPIYTQTLVPLHLYRVSPSAVSRLCSAPRKDGTGRCLCVEKDERSGVLLRPLRKRQEEA